MQQAYKPRSAAVSPGVKSHIAWPGWFSRYGYFFDPARSAPSWLVGSPHKNTRCKWLRGEILAANNNAIGYFIDAVWRLGGLSTNILRQHLPEQGWLHVMHPRTGNGWVPRPRTISPATGGCSHGRRYMAEVRTKPGSSKLAERFWGAE